MIDNMHRIYYRIHSFNFSISTNQEEIVDELFGIYSSLAADPCPISVEWSIKLISSKTNNSSIYGLYETDKLIFKSDNINEVIEECEWTVTLGILENLHTFLQLHASGVLIGENAVLFTGPPGSGKTMMALNLLLHGYPCLSDEIILIDPDKMLAFPLPRSFHIEYQILDFFPTLSLREPKRVFLDASGKVRFNPQVIKKDWVAKQATPRWIIFLEHNPENKNQLIPVGQTEALSLLIEQSINLMNYGDQGVDVLVDLIKKCICYKFKAVNIESYLILLENLND